MPDPALAIAGWSPCSHVRADRGEGRPARSGSTAVRGRQAADLRRPLRGRPTSGASTSTRCLGRRRPLVASAASAPTPASARPDDAGLRRTRGRVPRRLRAERRRGRPVARTSRSSTSCGAGRSFVNVACCECVAGVRLVDRRHGGGARPGEGVFVKAPGRRARTLAGEAPRATSRCHGGTVYWREGGQARSAAAGTGVTGGEARMLEPVRMRRRRRCVRRAPAARTIVASGSCACTSGRRAVRLPDRPPRRSSCCRVGAAADRRRSLAARARRGGTRRRARHAHGPARRSTSRRRRSRRSSATARSRWIDCRRRSAGAQPGSGTCGWRR